MTTDLIHAKPRPLDQSLWIWLKNKLDNGKYPPFWKSMTTGLIHAKLRPLDKAYKQVSLAYTRLNPCGYG